MKTPSTTEDTTMRNSNLALLLSLTFTVAAMAGCSKQAPTDAAPNKATTAVRTIPSDEQAARYVDPKIGLKTTPFSMKVPAEHPTEARTAPKAH